MSREIGRAPTVNASRYLQQLAKHWSHRNEVVFSAASADIGLNGNRVQLRAEPDALAVTLTAARDSDAARLREVFEAHINRFAFREAPLAFQWGGNEH